MLTITAARRRPARSPSLLAHSPSALAVAGAAGGRPSPSCGRPLRPPRPTARAGRAAAAPPCAARALSAGGERPRGWATRCASPVRGRVSAPRPTAAGGSTSSSARRRDAPRGARPRPRARARRGTTARISRRRRARRTSRAAAHRTGVVAATARAADYRSGAGDFAEVFARCHAAEPGLPQPARPGPCRRVRCPARAPGRLDEARAPASPPVVALSPPSCSRPGVLAVAGAAGRATSDPHGDVGAVARTSLDRILQAAEAESTDLLRAALVAEGRRLFRTTNAPRAGRPARAATSAAAGRTPTWGRSCTPSGRRLPRAARRPPALWGVGGHAPRTAGTGRRTDLEEFVPARS